MNDTRSCCEADSNKGVSRDDVRNYYSKAAVAAIILLMLLLPVSLLAYDEGGCDIPYHPTNMLKVIYFYSETMDFIAYGPEQCRKDFAKDVRRVVADTFLMTYGCIDGTLHDIDKALEKKYAPQIPPQKNAK